MIANRDEAIKFLGIVAYDNDITVEFQKACTKATGKNPYGHVVWCYDYIDATGTRVHSVFGWPAAITPQGAAMLARMIQY